MKNKFKTIQLFILLLFVLLLSSCYYDVEETVIPEDTVISFTLDIQPIFTENCILCHPGLIPEPDLTIGNSYDAIINGKYIIPEDLETSTLYQKFLGNPTIMPPSGSLPTYDINLVKTWIEQGALNN